MTPLLIVDNDVELCTLLTDRLHDDGFVLHAVHDGIEGLSRASSGNYCLVILDITLPRMGVNGPAEDVAIPIFRSSSDADRARR